MVIQMFTRDGATIQQAINRYKQGKGLRILGQFVGRGSTDLVAVRQIGSTLEGQYPVCREDEWYQITAVFFDTGEGYPLKAQSQELIRLLSNSAGSVLHRLPYLHNYILELELLLEEYRTFVAESVPETPDAQAQKQSLLEHTDSLFGQAIQDRLRELYCGQIDNY